jgi:signal transduction histidine kinase
MGSNAPALTFEENLSLAGHRFRWLLYFWIGVYLGSLVLTLVAVLWKTPGPWGWREAALVILVLLQIIHYCVWFVATHFPGWPLTWPWLVGHLALSLGVWLIEWHLDTSFWWIIWMQVFQIYISLPLKAAIPVASLIFLVFAHFDSGLSRFFGFPLGEVVERLIPWVIMSMSFSALEMVQQHELELATLRERERLARDMHDNLGHALVTLSIQLEAVQRLYPVDPAGALNRIDELKNLIRSSMDGLRRALAGLRAPGLENRPLSQTLHDLSREVSQRTGLELTCRVTADIDRLHPLIGEALWRITQEALMNVEKHAAARRVQIDLQMRPEAVTLRISDDGVGLPPDATQRPGHYGLRGMHERIEGLGGTLTVGRNGQAGTTLEAWLPLIGRSAQLQEA